MPLPVVPVPGREISRVGTSTKAKAFTSKQSCGQTSVDTPAATKPNSKTAPGPARGSGKPVLSADEASVPPTSTSTVRETSAERDHKSVESTWREWCGWCGCDTDPSLPFTYALFEGEVKTAAVAVDITESNEPGTSIPARSGLVSVRRAINANGRTDGTFIVVATSGAVCRLYLPATRQPTGDETDETAVASRGGSGSSGGGGRCSTGTGISCTADGGD